jgi:antitoxin ParD1/3/4
MVVPTRSRPQNLGNAQAKLIVEGIFSQIAEVARAGAKQQEKVRERRERSRLIIVDKRHIFVSVKPMENRMISADLGKQLENYIQQLVDTGRYGSKSEVLREGVRLVQDRETRLAALDASIIRGIADAEAGRTKPASDVFDRLEAKYSLMADQAEKSA